MLTVTPIIMMIHAEEHAKHIEQNHRILAEEMRHAIPSEKPASRWLDAISHFVAHIRRKAQNQPAGTTCYVEGHSCASISSL